MLKIRVIKPSDASRVAKIHASSFENKWSEQSFLDLFEKPFVFGFIAESGDEPQAFIVAQTLAEDIEIITFATNPGFRRQGAGDALLTALEKLAEETATRKIFLEVDAINEAAIKLYLKHGFKQTGRRKGYYSHQDGASDALLFELSF